MRMGAWSMARVLRQRFEYYYYYMDFSGAYSAPIHKDKNPVVLCVICGWSAIMMLTHIVYTCSVYMLCVCVCVCIHAYIDIMLALICMYTEPLPQ